MSLFGCLCWGLYCLFGDNTVHFGRVEAAGSNGPEDRKGLFTLFFIYLEDLLAGCFWLDLVQTLRSEKTCCHVDPFLCSLLVWCHQVEETFSVLLQRFCFHSDAPKLEGSRGHNKTDSLNNGARVVCIQNALGGQ